MSDEVKKDIEVLRKIKQCDDELYDLNSSSEECKKSNTEVFNRIQSIEKSIELIDEEILKFKESINNKKEEIEKHKEDIEKLKNSKTKEIEESETKKIDYKIETADLSIQVLEKEINKLGLDIKEKEDEKNEFLGNKENLLQIDCVKDVDNMKKKIVEINKNKKILLKQLNSEVLREYQKVSYENLEHKCLSNLVKGFCDNCFIQATKQQELGVLEEKFLVKCEYCGSIFVEIKNNC